MCGYYHPGDLGHWVIDLLGDSKARERAVRYWVDDSTIVGLAVCGLFGCAFQVLVHPDRRGGADEAAWLLRAEALTKELMAARQVAHPSDGPITDVFDCDVLRRRSLEGLGYQAYRVWDHVNERPVDETMTVSVPPPGFIVRAATDSEQSSLKHLTGVVFGDVADLEPIYAREGGEPACCAPRSCTFVVVSPTGELAGLATVHLDDRNRVGLFEPVGVHPRFRRLGLARSLLSHGLHAMAAAGMQTARVSHDASNTGAARLYQSLGFEKRHVTLGYRREMPGRTEPTGEATC